MVCECNGQGCIHCQENGEAEYRRKIQLLLELLKDTYVKLGHVAADARCDYDAAPNLIMAAQDFINYKTQKPKVYILYCPYNLDSECDYRMVIVGDEMTQMTQIKRFKHGYLTAHPLIWKKEIEEATGRKFEECDVNMFELEYGYL